MFLCVCVQIEALSAASKWLTGRKMVAAARLALVGYASAASVTPVEKVITLLTDMKSTAVSEASAAGTTYDTFACFCKTTTKAKSKSVVDGEDKIEELSGNIEEKTATKEDTATDLDNRKKKQEELSTDFDDTSVRCTKEKAVYDAEAADMDKAMFGLDTAIKALDASQPASFISLRKVIRSNLAMAEHKLAPAERVKVKAFLQVDPMDPEYDFHSQGILDVLHDMSNTFSTSKSELDAEWAKTKENCDETKKDLTSAMTENTAAMKQCDQRISSLRTEIGSHRQSLVESEALMKDDRLYLQDLTTRCEARAADFDQQSQMRGSEITALSQALEVLTNKVKSKDEAANQRALLQQVSVQRHLNQDSTTSDSLSFFQRSSGMFLQKSTGAASAEARKQKAIDILRSEAGKLRSTALASLIMHVSSNPFAKVKTLIQQLIERMLQEATAEATKKGFCDKELGKANSDKEFRMAEVYKLNAAIKSLEATADELDLELKTLTSDLGDSNADLSTATDDRKAEKKVNLQTLKDAKEGLTAVAEALMILKTFYKQAAKATVLVQASPVDETAPEAAKGAYKGNQDGAKAILGLLEVVVSDFQRTIARTTEEEEKSAAAFVKFERTSKSDIGGKETKKELDTQDLADTKSSIDRKTQEMKDNMGMVDSALKELEELKPMCISTGMSYEQRVEKRESEIAALKKALCQLDPDGVEADCV